jgi:hypothetical protein
MEAVVTLAISLGLLALMLFGLMACAFFMLVGVAFALIVEGVPRRGRGVPSVGPPRVVSPVLFPRRRRGDWERERAA